MAIVDELIAVLGFDLRGEGELRKFEQSLDRAEKGAKGFASAFVAIGGAVAGALAGLQIGRMAGDFVGSIATVNAEFESYQATLETITGSSEKAKAALDWVTEFGRTTPYEVSEVTEAFVRLKSYGIDPTNGTLRAIGDASSAMGKGLMQGVEAVADAATGEFERLKEFGVRASVAGDQVTFAWTENGKTIEKTVKKQGDEITSFMLENFGRFNGAMDKQSKTWKGMTSNLADNWTGFLREIGEAGYYDDIKRRLTGVLDTVDMWRENGTFKRLAKGISDGLIGALNTTSHLASQAYRVGAAFFHAAAGVNDLVSRVSGLSSTMTAAGLGAGLLASSAMGRGLIMAVARKVPYVAAALAIDDIISGLNGDDSLVGSTEQGAQALENLKTKFADLQTAAQGLADSLGGVREKIVTSLSLPPEAFSSIDDIKTRWAALREEYGKPLVFAGVDLGNLGTAFDTVQGWAENSVSNFQLLFTDPTALVVKLLAEAVDRVAYAFDRIAGILSALASPIESIKAAIESIRTAMADLAGMADSIIPNQGMKAVASAAPITSTGSVPQAPRPRTNYQPDAGLSRDGMQTAEGLRVEYGVSEEGATKAASTIADIISSIGSMSAMAKAALDISGFVAPANQALAIQGDLSRGINATANLDISPWMAQVARAKAELQSLQSMAGARAGAAVAPRPAVVQSASTP